MASIPQSNHESVEQTSLRRYWRANLRLMALLLFVWALVSLGCGVLWADALNRWHLPGTGYPLGFWFAQQGSILAFVLIVLIYCLVMNRFDARHQEELGLLRDEAAKKEHDLG
jgi:putative solute:sodium symporter small subunit